MRAKLLALVLMAAPAAYALEPADVVGVWDTQWADATDAPLGDGGPMLVSLDSSPELLDGMTPAPGMDGVMNGEATRQADGTLVWDGRWASVWPEGATMGTFRIVFTDADHFTGAWSTDDKQVRGAAWAGTRAH